MSMLSICLCQFVSATALTLSPSPSPPVAATKYPNCIVHDTALRSGAPVFTDVRPFIRRVDAQRHRVITFGSAGQIGMLLHDDPHDLGELVKDVLPDSQAADAGVQKGWIITEIDGRAFSKNERLKDVADDFAKAKREGVTLTVKYDIRSFLDCAKGDCSNSDRFPVDDAEICADACVQTAGCDWWSHGTQDADSMCWLQSQNGSSLIKWQGLHSAPRTCAPEPVVSSSRVLSAFWPFCQVRDSQISVGGEPVFADVSQFIRHGDSVRHRTVTFKSEPQVGLVLREKPHADGEVVDDVLQGSAAWKAGVRRGWIIKEIDGKAFQKNETLPGLVALTTVAKEKAPTIVVKFDVRSFQDCSDGDCSRSDKLPVASEAECASACREIERCQWWSYGFEEEDAMCWLRNSNLSLQPQKGAISGQRGCSPPTRAAYCKLLSLLMVVSAVLCRQQILNAFYNRHELIPFLTSSSRKSKTDGGVSCDYKPVGKSEDDFELDLEIDDVL